MGCSIEACQMPTRLEDQQRRTARPPHHGRIGTALRVVPLLLLNREHLYRAT